MPIFTMSNSIQTLNVHHADKKRSNVGPWLLMFAVFAAGCGSVRVGSNRYVSTATITKVGKPLPNAQSQNLVETPGTILNSGTGTIAFYPSSVCRDPGNPAASALKNECLLMITLLERYAAGHGFKVVSWTQFGSNPWVASKQLGLDVLFIVDDVYIQWTTPDDYRMSGLVVAKQESAEERGEVQIDDQASLAVRCQGIFNTYYPTSAIPPRMAYVSASIQMLSASDGAPKWVFSDREANTHAEEAPKQQELFFEGVGRKRKGLGGAIAGGVLTAMGIGAVSAGTVMYRTGNSLTKRNTGAGLAWGSAILFGIGLPIGAVGIVRETKEAVYPKAEDVLCSNAHLIENPYPSNTSLTPATIDHTAETKNALEAIVERFYGALNTLKRNAPAPAAPPLEGPAEPAPSPTEPSTDTDTQQNQTGGEK